VLHVLVAEDNLVNQRLATRLLEKRGHRVVVAAGGRQALEALETGPFDLVLMDVQTPKMDGLEATAAIRKRESSTGEHQPIIALTAHAMKGDLERCLAAGTDGYLAKPIRPQEPDAILEKYLAWHKRIGNPSPIVQMTQMSDVSIWSAFREQVRPVRRTELKVGGGHGSIKSVAARKRWETTRDTAEIGLVQGRPGR